MDFGKFKYQQKKKSHKQHSHHVKIKEIRVRPKTGDHDLVTKVNQARGFLEHKDKVIVSVVFRGRELAHIEEGHRVLKRLLEMLDTDGKLEAPLATGQTHFVYAGAQVAHADGWVARPTWAWFSS